MQARWEWAQRMLVFSEVSHILINSVTTNHSKWYGHWKLGRASLDPIDQYLTIFRYGSYPASAPFSLTDQLSIHHWQFLLICRWQAFAWQLASWWVSPLSYQLWQRYPTIQWHGTRRGSWKRGRAKYDHELYKFFFCHWRLSVKPHGWFCTFLGQGTEPKHLISS